MIRLGNFFFVILICLGSRLLLFLSAILFLLSGLGLFWRLTTVHDFLLEDELSRFFEQSLELLCIAALDGYFKRLNPAWVTQLGWTCEELLARPFLDFVHSDDHEATQAEVGKLGEGKQTIR